MHSSKEAVIQVLIIWATPHINCNVPKLPLYLMHVFTCVHSTYDVSPINTPHVGQGGTGICSECSPSYTGPNCELSIPMVVVPTILAVTAVITVCIILSIWYIRR